MLQAPINRIIDLSTVDGPGCRTSIFFQKCNIHCLYCHNPETQNLCIHCGKCISHCPVNALEEKQGQVLWHKEKCIQCDTCLKVCENHASPKVEYLTPEEVYARVRKNLGFIRGITTSGGECSLYPEFISKLFALAKKDNLTCLMDSNGMLDYSKYPNLMKSCDGVMLDIKSWSEDTYRKLTGYSNVIVKNNLKYLDRNDKIEELRIVYVPQYVDAKECLMGIQNTLDCRHIETVRIKLIAFRRNGVRGILENHPSPTADEMNDLASFAISLGFRNIEIR
jgi:pyruvate formate lyase activating enzyme